MPPILNLNFLWIFLFISSPLFAQKNFQSGYVVLRSSDTLRGQIDYREWDVNPRRIVFEPQNGGQSMTYSVEDISGFGVAGDSYEGYTVKLYPYSMEPVVVVNENFSSTPYEKAVFLRLITKGELNLLLYKDSTSTEYYFLQRKKEQPFQLRLISRAVGADGHIGVVFDPYYKIQLQEPLASCATALKMAAKVEYKLSHLKKLIFSYNHCGQDTVEKQPAKDRGKVTFSPLIGVISSKVKFNGSSSLDGMNFPSYTGLAGGGSLLCVLPRSRGQFGFVAELLYHHVSSTSSFAEENLYINSNATLNYNLLKLDLLFRYSLPSDGKVRPFIQGGVANSFVAGNKSHQDYYNSVDNTVSKEPLLYGSSRKYQPGLLIGGGVVANRLSFELRYEQSSGMSDFPAITSPIRNFYFLVGFAL